MARFVTVDVDVCLSDIDSDELIEEIESRGYDVSKNGGVDGDFDAPNLDLHAIVQMHRCGNSDWQAKAIEYLYEKAGKIV